MIPFINNSVESLLSIPEMSGGMNLRDGLSLVRDDQLTDCKNMWYRDGMLRTRLRLRVAAKVGGLSAFKRLDRRISSETVIYDGVRFIEDGEVYYLTVSFGRLSSEIDGDGTLFEFCLVNERRPQVCLKIASKWFFSTSDITHFAFKYENDIYCFYSDGGDSQGILKFSKGDRLRDEWTRDEITKNYLETVDNIEELKEKLDIPIIATDGLPSCDDSMSEFNGTINKSYNLLCPYYTAQYSTVDKSVDESTMQYPLVYLVMKGSADDTTWRGMAGKYIFAEYFDKSGKVYKHKAQIDATYGNAEELGSECEDGYAVHLWQNLVYFTPKEWTEGVDSRIRLKKEDYVCNNLKITAPVPNYEENVVKLFDMTKAIRYGGQGTGDGGSRLFLTGNTKESEKSLVVWSALDDPLCFSQNAYVYVGDKDQAVTTFGKMSGELILFKENEIHLMDYTKGNTSADNGNIPTILINGNVGCDCPDTVQLCRNRLVWADSHGKVYSLVSQNQNNEHNIFEVSEMIERKLKGETNLKNAHSADYMGHYILQVDNRIYVMDYNSYGYNYVSSYSKAEDANLLIPWYYWELDVLPRGIIAANDILSIPLTSAVGWDENGSAHFIYDIYYTDGSYGDDEAVRWGEADGFAVREIVERPIESVVQTKLFDFGQPSRKKTVTAADISFGYNDGRPITVSFISERGIPDEHTVAIGAAEAEMYSPGYVHSCRFYPYTNAAVMFGMRVTCEGEMAIDSLSLRCRRLRW